MVWFYGQGGQRLPSLHQLWKRERGRGGVCECVKREKSMQLSTHFCKHPTAPECYFLGLTNRMICGCGWVEIRRFEENNVCMYISKFLIIICRTDPWKELGRKPPHSPIFSVGRQSTSLIFLTSSMQYNTDIPSISTLHNPKKSK